ncbi:MAG: glycosyltransferase family 39 protein [Prolixibacteraceae bacterium]|jgi:4-amino-4-deoxy-L-arabinose transferase-like glycosyltransferase
MPSVETRIRILITLLGALFFFSFNGAVHLFDWDEINFAESAREMIVTGDYSTVRINFIPFWEKPPLYIWLQVLSMKAFGINEFAARFPNAVCGVLTLLVLFEIGNRQRNYRFGLFWALAYGASVLPFLYFKSGIIDPWFNLFIFLAVYFAYSHFEKKGQKPTGSITILLSGAMLGLAVLTKGPVAILLFGLTLIVYIAVERKFRMIKVSDFFLFCVTTILIGGAYHIYQMAIGNWQLIHDFFVYQLRLLKTEDAGHGGSIFYHAIVLFIGVFPASVLALPALFKKTSRTGFELLMVALFWIVLVIFSLVKTKIVHYSSLCYFPISFLAAVTMYRISTSEIKLGKATNAFLLVIGFIFALSPALIQFLVSPEWRPFLQKYVHDDFALACLNRSVHWSGWEFFPGLILGLSLIISQFLKAIKRIVMIYAGITVFVILFMMVLLPKIEKYSQGAAIDFITELKDQNVWISTLGYKSYATYFYSEKNGRACESIDENGCLLEGTPTRDIYFIVKVTSVDHLLSTYPQLELVKKDGGFALLKRHQ